MHEGKPTAAVEDPALRAGTGHASQIALHATALRVRNWSTVFSHPTAAPNAPAEREGRRERGSFRQRLCAVFRQPLYSVSGHPLRVNQMTQQRREHALGRDTAPSAATDRSSPRARRTRRTPQLLPFECASSPPPHRRRACAARRARGCRASRRRVHHYPPPRPARPTGRMARRREGNGGDNKGMRQRVRKGNAPRSRGRRAPGPPGAARTAAARHSTARAAAAADATARAIAA